MLHEGLECPLKRCLSDSRPLVTPPRPAFPRPLWGLSCGRRERTPGPAAAPTHGRAALAWEERSLGWQLRAAGPCVRWGGSTGSVLSTEMGSRFLSGIPLEMRCRSAAPCGNQQPVGAACHSETHADIRGPSQMVPSLRGRAADVLRGHRECRRRGRRGGTRAKMPGEAAAARRWVDSIPA